MRGVLPPPTLGEVMIDSHTAACQSPQRWAGRRGGQHIQLTDPLKCSNINKQKKKYGPKTVQKEINKKMTPHTMCNFYQGQ